MNPSTQPVAVQVTKTFTVFTWAEIDRVRVNRSRYIVTMTGEQSAQPAELASTIDGNPATMDEVGDIIAWAKNGHGSIEKAAS